MRSLKVLVVDDNTINQRVAIGLLRALGHNGVVVGDGQKALKCLEAMQFDVVLMDVMMPVMDGMQALAAIRAKEAGTGTHLPVLMVTAYVEPGDVARFKLAGADGYVAKPLDMQQLQDECLRVLS